MTQARVRKNFREKYQDVMPVGAGAVQCHMSVALAVMLRAVAWAV